MNLSEVESEFFYTLKKHMFLWSENRREFDRLTKADINNVYLLFKAKMQKYLCTG